MKLAESSFVIDAAVQRLRIDAKTIVCQMVACIRQGCSVNVALLGFVQPNLNKH